MRYKFFGPLIVLVLLAVSIIPVAASPPPPNYRPVDVGPELRDKGPSEVSLSLEGFEASYAEAADSSTEPSEYVVGDVIPALWYDDTVGLYLADYEVRAVGEHIEVWVRTNLDFPDGDPRNPVVVTQEQIDYLVDEFDNNIYPTMVDFFGQPDFHDGSNAALPFDYLDPEGRTIAMISNIGDENFHDPSYPLYIAGFYWGSVFEYYLDRNVISIDAYDWENRVGDDAPIANLYEGVFAHEYQHLLHDDYDSDEDTFINEGLSDLAEFLVGYGHPESHVNAAANLPENSLTLWGDQGDLEILADYGNSYLFQYYLMEKFGEEFIQSEFLNPENGMDGVSSTLSAFGADKDFVDVFHDFAVALLIDEPIKRGKYMDYKFETFDFNLNVGTPDSPNPEAYDTPGAPPWGTDYLWLDGDPKDLGKFNFNGVDYSVVDSAWSSDGEVLYSGTGDLITNWAIFETTGGGTLTFDTYWDIEDFWDFGFVQVSTDGGHTWMSLSNAYTTSEHDDAAHPDIVANLPGLTGWSCYYVEEGDPCWLTLSFDLSAYAGQDILVGFRYMTDWATTYEGWYLDNIYVDDELISDGSDASIFNDVTEYVPAEYDFTLTFVGMADTPFGLNNKVYQFQASEMDKQDMFKVQALLKGAERAMLMVTFDAPEGFTQYGEYTYDFTFFNEKPDKGQGRK